MCVPTDELERAKQLIFERRNLMLTIKEVVIQTLGAFGVPFDVEVVGLLERRVFSSVANFSKDKPYNPNGLAYTITKNWAVDWRRKISRDSKRQAAALLVQEEVRKEAELFQRCEQEFDRIVSKLLPDLCCTQSMQLHIVRLRRFGGRSDAECGKVMPGRTIEQRNKWSTRGLELVMPHASPELSQYLSQQHKKEKVAEKTRIT